MCLTEDDSHSSLYDMTERIRQLNEEMAKESPLQESGPTQSSVKFKDTLVDFISPTPEPELDSEEDAGSAQNTPRSDAAEQSPCPSDSADPASVLSEADSSTLVTNDKSESGQDQLLPDSGDSENPTALSEVEPTESDQKLSSTYEEDERCSQMSDMLDSKSTQADTNSQPAASDMEEVKTDAETADETCSSPSGKTREKCSSDPKRSVSNAVLAGQVVGALRKSARNSQPKSAEEKPVGSKSDADKTRSETREKSLSDPKQAICNTLMAAKVVNSLATPNRDSRSEVRPAGGEKNAETFDSKSDADETRSKTKEKSLSDSKQALSNTLMAAKVVSSLATPNRDSRSEVRPAGGEKNAETFDSKSDADETRSRTKEESLSDPKQALCNTLMAAKVVSSLATPNRDSRSAEVRPAGGDRNAKTFDSKSDANETRSKTKEESLSDSKQALSNTLMAAKVVSSLAMPNRDSRPRSAEETLDSKSDADETHSKTNEKSLADSKQALCNTLMAAKVMSTLGTPNRVSRPRSAEVWPVVGGGRKPAADPELDDMALVECSGRFRMMSVAELTALQRRCASSRSPDVVSRTPRLAPSSLSPCRLTPLYQLFLFK